MKIKLIRNIADNKQYLEFENKKELENYLFYVWPNDLGGIIGKPPTKWTIEDLIAALPYAEYTRT